MGELYHNVTPFFTQWVVRAGYLHEPFVVIDVGVQGGPHQRWEYLANCARVYGFDPISEVIQSLDKSKGSNQFYRAIALGNEDGERRFKVTSNTYESSFDTSSTDTGSQGVIALGPRSVEVRRLDTLFAAGEIPPADHIKIDCEGFEPEVIRGARNYLARSNVLCVTTETNFGVSPAYLRTPFVDICENALRASAAGIRSCRCANRPSELRCRACATTVAEARYHERPTTARYWATWNVRFPVLSGFRRRGGFSPPFRDIARSIAVTNSRQADQVYDQF
jgi:FkbM family methyltransferase